MPAGQAAGPVPPAIPVPSAGALRARLRRARREHSGGRAGDLYLVLLLIVVLGAAVPQYLARHLAHRSQAPAAVSERWWLVISLAVAVAGLCWLALRALGPLLAMPAAQAWCLSSPVGRRGWLIRPLGYLLLAGAVAGAGLGALGALLAGAAGHSASGALIGWVALLYAGIGTAVAGFAAAAQGRRRSPAEPVPAVLGLAGAVAVIVSHYAGLVPAAPSPPVLWPALAAVLVAAAAGTAALLRLDRLDRAAPAAGAALAGAAAAAAIFMDPTLFAGVLEARRWRRIGRIGRRARRARPGPRWSVLLRAELRRLPRRPQALLVSAGLLLVPYAIELLAPPWAGMARVVAGYLAVNRLAAGLRTICRSPALRRALGGTDRQLRLAHLVVPAAGALLWWLAGSELAAPAPAQLVFVAGLVFAVYRNAATPPIRYGGAMVDTPFGLVPTDLLRQILRGLDVVAVLTLVAWLWPGGAG
ncbi:hypothetical protein GCM10023322_19260 [Rugosimonospora acidiphila]|uniref:ABC transporter permease n=2 Tax=Rugosimonospora acidiphila TaxID=556531 RepID=A0ABP9RQ58_9ACTN